MAKTARGLTVSQRTNKSWRAQIRKRGYAHESKDFLSHADADAWGLSRLAEITATGRLTDRRPAERTTLEAALLAYKDKVVSKRRDASRSADEARIERFIRQEKKLCSYAIAHVSTEMMEEWRDRRLTETVTRGLPGGRGQHKAEVVPKGRIRKDGRPRANAAKPKPDAKPSKVVSPSTVRREMTLLKRVFDFAMRQYRLAQNPMAKEAMDRPAAQDERDVRLTVAEFDRLLDSCRASRNPLLAPFVEVALEVGSRRGSLSRLMWDDVRFDEASVTLRGVKNSRAPLEVRDIEVGLSPRAMEVLRSLPRTDARVFPTTIEALSTAFDRARARVGLDHFRMHDVRHQAASRLVEAGWGILDVMAQLDWRDVKSARRYYTARGSHLGAKLAQLAPSSVVQGSECRAPEGDSQGQAGGRHLRKDRSTLATPEPSTSRERSRTGARVGGDGPKAESHDALEVREGLHGEGAQASAKNGGASHGSVQDRPARRQPQNVPRGARYTREPTCAHDGDEPLQDRAQPTPNRADRDAPVPRAVQTSSPVEAHREKPLSVRPPAETAPTSDVKRLTSAHRPSKVSPGVVGATPRGREHVTTHL